MKRGIAILLAFALLILTACAPGGQTPASEPESSSSTVSEPGSASASSEPEPAPMPDLQPGRVLAFGDERMNPAVSGKAERGTQAELDRWKEVVRDPAIAKLDFNKMHQEEMELPVDQARRILTALRDAEVRLYEGNPDPSTGGGCTVIAYDEEENVLFRANYLGDWFEVWFPAGDSYDRYYFDGEETTLDALLRSEYGKAADITPPEPDHAGDPDWPSSGEDPITGPPDMEAQENPDTSVMYTDEENAAWQREFAFVDEIDAAFSQNLSKESYSYYYAYSEGAGKEMKLVLEIGVIDEAAVDAHLAAWTGTKWDKLVKKPGSASQAKQEAFVKEAEKLDLGPDVNFEIRAEDGFHFSEKWKILTSVYAPQEQAELWKELPQKIKDLAKEMGIPEIMLDYIPPRYSASGTNPDGTVTNPDT